MGQVEYELVGPEDVDVGELLEFYRSQRYCLTTSAEKIRDMLERSHCVVIARELATRVLGHLREVGVERVDVIAHGTEEDFCRDLGFRPVRGAVTMQLDPRTMACAASAMVGEEMV